MKRVALWYWNNFVYEDRCLCRIHMGWLCDWLETRYVLPLYERAVRGETK